MTDKDILARQLEACRGIGTYLEGRKLTADTPVRQIVGGTGARSKETFGVITQLAARGSTRQAAMLCRSLFEDMAVAHWLVLHEDDPDFLVRRFHDQLDAIRLYEDDDRKRYGQAPIEDISELTGRERELRDAFGDHAQLDWWGVRRDGTRIGLPKVVEELARADRFKQRFMVEKKPILEEMFDAAQKWNNQQLHHTAVGFPLRLDRGGQPPRTVSPPHTMVVLLQGYWVYAQLVYLVLDVIPNQGPDTWRDFERIFMAGLDKDFAGAWDEVWEAHMPDSA